MTTKTEYQQYARKCILWAARAATEEERRAFLEMADAWTRVALVDRMATARFAGDVKRAQQQIPFNAAIGVALGYLHLPAAEPKTGSTTFAFDDCTSCHPGSHGLGPKLGPLSLRA
jgi:hypothetical protein